MSDKKINKVPCSSCDREISIDEIWHYRVDKSNEQHGEFVEKFGADTLYMCAICNAYNHGFKDKE